MCNLTHFKGATVFPQCFAPFFIMQKKIKDLTGLIVNKLTVIEYRGTDKNRLSIWLCRCECGKYKVTHGTTLTSNRIRDCGNHKIHNGLSNKHSGLYHRWFYMVERCHNPNYNKFKNYGGRGISVCPSWRKSFIKFLDWSLKNGYDKNLALDRRDNNGNYSPQNCRYVTDFVNNQNKRTNKIIEYKGVVKCIAEWGRITGMGSEVISSRLKSGWAIIDIIETPIERKFSHPSRTTSKKK